MQAFFMAFPLTVISILASARGNRRSDGHNIGAHLQSAEVNPLTRYVKTEKKPQ